MKRLIPILFIASLAATACGQTPSLWGTYATPTTEGSASLPLIMNQTPAPASPTADPTATFTSPPTPPTLDTPTPANGASFLEATLTPTFDVAPVLYYAQSGDTLPAVAARFNVDPAEVHASIALPQTGLIDPGTLLVIPDRIEEPTTPNVQIMPDSEVIFSATALDFDANSYVENAHGYLSNYQEYLGSTGWTKGADAIKRLAYENSVNPRLLLAILEYESRWVRARPVDTLHVEYPMGYEDFRYKSLFSQMVWAVNQISIGYYDWRAGTLTELKFPDGTKLRLDPRLNAGTVALQYLFSQLHSQSQWAQIINPNTGFPAMYAEMFGDPWARGELVNPIFPAGLTQPPMVLPFQPNIEWSFSGGPHGAWEHDGALAAIDFAPATDHGGCDVTTTWVVAAAPGLVVRSENGVVVIDLDGDGYEQTGWDLLYLHIATKDRIPAGTWVETDDKIGHASCEGGVATGTHLHLARKYNGEWVPADGPVPFVLSDWVVHAGAKPYEGTMTRGDQSIVADPVGQLRSVIFRKSNE